jgi:hypothetical protein
MLIEGGNTSPQRNFKQKNIVTIKTIDSERFAEIHLCYYYEKIEFSQGNGGRLYARIIRYIPQITNGRDRI